MSGALNVTSIRDVAVLPNDGFARRELEYVDDPAKDDCRARVLSHILRYHGSHPLRLLSFPGLRWTFERQLDSVRGGGNYFIGLERDPIIAARSVQWMPGTRRQLIREQLTIGELEVVVSSRARLMYVDCETFFHIGRKQIGSREGRAKWRNAYRLWSAIWLDFTGNLCFGVEKCLQRLATHSLISAKVPIAITVFKGRESRDITTKLNVFYASRAEYIEALLDAPRPDWPGRFMTDGTFEYKSAAGATMLTVLGHFDQVH